MYLYSDYDCDFDMADTTFTDGSGCGLCDGGVYSGISVLPSPLEQSAIISARISGLPEPFKILDQPNFNNSGMASMGTDDFTDDIRVGDNARVLSQELKYGPGGSLPESLHEDAHRMPDIRSAGEKYGPKVEEIHCDIRSGMLSGWAGAPKDAFRGEIGPTSGDFEHPDGIDRIPYYEKAYDLAANDPFKDFLHPDNNPFLQAKIDALEQTGIHQFGCRTV